MSPTCDVGLRQTERDAEYRETDEDEFHYESPARAAERVRRFATIKDLLTADTPRHLLSGSRVSHPESSRTGPFGRSSARDNGGIQYALSIR